MTVFQRQPTPCRGVRETMVETGDVALSGLVAEPVGGTPRALIVAIHGAGMHAGYFDASTAPGLSLLQLGSQLGFTVWAPDRPGIGASADLDDERIVLFPQAAMLLDALDAFAATHEIGAGVLLVGHSYGLKVALTMAAHHRGPALLGIDGVGTGIRFAFTPVGERAPVADGDRGPTWGPAHLYPPATFERGALPLHAMPSVQAAERDRWPDDLRSFGDRIDVPLRLTYGEHERFWPTDEEHLAELREAVAKAPRFSVEIEPRVGHNVSLGWAARSYHLKVVAFAESCLIGHAAC